MATPRQDPHGEFGRPRRAAEIEPAREHVARQGFDPVYGARPLKRFLQHELESKIARALIAGEVQDGALLQVDVKDGHLDVEIENPKEAEVPVGA